MSAAAVEPDDVYPPQSPQNAESAASTAIEIRDVRGRFGPGNRPKNPGGRPKKLRELEKLLNTEHRNIPMMREVFNRLRALAMGEPIIVPFVGPDGEVKLECQLKADARFMQLYLDRIMGPAKAFDDSIDLSDAPDEVLQWLGRYIQQK